MSTDHFAKALHNFTMDAAAGDAIRHLTDKGFTVSQIRKTLTFPAPAEYVETVMLERLIETRKILTEDAAAAEAQPLLPDQKPEHIIEHYDRYGKKSFLRVKKESPEEIFSPEDYVRFKNLWVLMSAQEQVSSLSDHTLLKVRSTGSHRDM